MEFHGHCTGKDLESANHDWYADPRFDGMHYFIADFTGITSHDLDGNDAEYAAALDNGASLTRGRLKGAIVATDDAVRDLSEEYIRLSRGLGTNWEFRLFDSLPDARRWIED